VDLFRLSQGNFEDFGSALAKSVNANVEQMPEEEKKKLIAAATASGAPSLD
jgi:hypothetical protein